MSYKTVGILTHYNVNNQGAQLQTYATYNWLKEHNFKPYVLTYDKNFDFVEPELKKRNIIGFSSIPYILKEFLLKKGFRLTFFNYLKYKKNVKFRKKSFDYLPYARGNIDCAVIGADEVLSLENGINMMMFGHCIDSKKIIYYAPSCGKFTKDDYYKFNCEELVQSGLNKISCFSARDENTKKVLESFSNEKNIPIVLDPVLLYDFSNIDVKIKKTPKNYIIVYAYDKHMNDKNTVSAIKKFAKNFGYKIVSVGTFHKWCDYNFSCNCIEWLQYFKNAKFVITDTFHGTIASIINNVNCAVFVREELNSNKLNFLIKQIGIEKNKISEITYEQLCDKYKNKINYSKVNTTILKLRKLSESYLIDSLQEE